MNKKIVILVVFLLASLVHNINVSAQETENVYPILAITKTVNTRLISAGDNITVFIKITNVGNATAYNVTLIDNSIPSWAGSISGNITAHWESIRPNETVFHTYHIHIKDITIENVTLSSAKLIYYDASGRKYEVTSSEVTFGAKLPTRTPIDWDTLWRNVIIIEGTIIAIILSVMIFLEYRSYREYLQSSVKKSKK